MPLRVRSNIKASDEVECLSIIPSLDANTILVAGTLNSIDLDVVFTKKRIFLIDWEPVLVKRVNKKLIFRSTFPYYSVSDLKKKQISRKTDLIGFLFLSERLFSGKVNAFNFSKLKNDKWLEEYTKIKNYIFFKLTFIEIYDLVRLKYA